jgi:hypothetical protein
MTFAMLIIGVLFGVALSVTVALFAILSMEGRFSDNLRATAGQALRRLTGRGPRPGAGLAAGSRAPEFEARLRTLTEEVRVMQRLLDQTKCPSGTSWPPRSSAPAKRRRRSRRPLPSATNVWPRCRTA